jgi:hypothetical protein
LDSFAAYNLVKLLHQIASNCAILCTIHQPSADIFFLFDKAIFLKDGRVIYQGPTHGIEEYFAIQGFPCPINHNPCDFVMNLCQSYTIEELEEHRLIMPIPDEFTSELHSARHYGLHSMEFTFEASFLRQIQAIMYRGCVDLSRDYSTLVARLGRNVIMGMLYGLIFMNVGQQDNAIPDNLQSHVGAISMICMICMYFIAQSGLLTFQVERPMVLREYVTGTCKLPQLLLLFFSF